MMLFNQNISEARDEATVTWRHKCSGTCPAVCFLFLRDFARAVLSPIGERPSLFQGRKVRVTEGDLNSKNGSKSLSR